MTEVADGMTAEERREYTRIKELVFATYRVNESLSADKESGFTFGLLRPVFMWDEVNDPKKMAERKRRFLEMPIYNRDGKPLSKEEKENQFNGYVAVAKKESKEYLAKVSDYDITTKNDKGYYNKEFKKAYAIAMKVCPDFKDYDDMEKQSILRNIMFQNAVDTKFKDLSPEEMRKKLALPERSMEGTKKNMKDSKKKAQENLMALIKCFEGAGKAMEKKVGNAIYRVTNSKNVER